jgi:hypothetical protein
MSSGLRESSTTAVEPNTQDSRLTRAAASLSTVFTRSAALLFTGLHFYELVAGGAYTKLVVIAVIVAPIMGIAAWRLVRPRPARCFFSVRRFIRSSADEDARE